MLLNQQESVPGRTESRISDEAKFQLFKSIMDDTFQSFETMPMNNFSELTAGVIPWLEEHCKPHLLGSIVDRSLHAMTLQSTTNETNNTDGNQMT